MSVLKQINRHAGTLGQLSSLSQELAKEFKVCRKKKWTLNKNETVLKSKMLSQANSSERHANVKLVNFLLISYTLDI